jgi:hypothetical protein
MYKQKYLKYKQKYLALKQLKNLQGGSSFEELDFNTLPLQTLKKLATKRELVVDDLSTKDELVMILNSYRAEQKRIRESGAGGGGGGGGGGVDPSELRESREAEFKRRFGTYGLDNIYVSESEIATAKELYGDRAEREILIDFIKDTKREQIKRQIESDPEYLRLLTCQIQSKNPLSVEYENLVDESETTIKETQLKNAVKSVFNEEGWFVANARGDGRCMIHSIIHGIRDILGKNTLKINEPFEVIVFNAIKNYFEKTNNDGVLNFIILKIYRTDNDELLKHKINTILNQNAIEDELFFVLAIYFNINILQISHDTNVGREYIFRFQQVSELTKDNCIIIICYSGHYKLIYNTNKNITLHKIKSILSNQGSHEIINGVGNNLKLISGTWYSNNNSSPGGGGYDLERERALNEQRERALNEQRKMLITFDNDTLSSILQSYRINNLSNASTEIKINAIMDYLQKHPELLP